MMPDPWIQVQTLFEAARALEGDARAAFLERMCAGNTALLREIESLLDADQEAAGFLTGAINAGVRELANSQPAISAGERIGVYRILRELGRGGMGTVYLAEREDDYQARVAIKLIASDRPGPEVLARFLAERQILATLNHPNIARPLDGGTTADGSPFLVMEYVEGEPIDAYCDRRRLGIVDRIWLMLQACAAVQHAHTHLVVHRDLKPGNILVTAASEVRLLDFGIAKLLGDGGGVRTADATVLRPLTPTHASPEQITGGPISTATDVYALGVVLYQLLTGHHPHGVASGSPLELVRAIADGQPRRPIDVITVTGEGSGSDEESRSLHARIAAARSTTVERLRRTLTGDLDTILLMALRKEPERRYATVEQFADDLRRYLTHRPVRARPDTLAYRMGKFLARNRSSVAAAAAGIIVIITLVSFYTARLTTERDNVRAESAKVTEVAGFLTGLFETNDPNRSARQNVTARELLDRGRERIDADLSRQPAVRAAMLAAIGDAYRALAHYDHAGAALDSALAIRQRLHGERHTDVAASLLALARLHYDRGEYDAAEPLAQRALDMDRELLGNRNLTVAHDLNVLSSVITSQGHAQRALPLVREIVELRRELQGEEHPQYLTNLNNLGLLLSQTGDNDGAESIYRTIIEIRRRSGKDDPQLALTLENLAALLYLKGDVDSPLPLMREALAMRERIFGADHPELSTPRNNLAAMLRDRGETAEAESLLRRVIAIESALRGENHWYVAYYEVSLALVHAAQNNAAEAERLLRHALDVYGQTFTADNSYVANALVALGGVRLERDDAAEAESLFRRAVSVFQQAGPGAAWAAATAQNGLGAALVALGKPEEGGSLLLRSDSVLVMQRGENSRIARTSAERVARFYQSTGRPELAARYSARAH